MKIIRCNKITFTWNDTDAKWDIESQEVYINTELIKYFYEYTVHDSVDKYTQIEFLHDALIVKETPEQIHNKILD